jgi:hypothetical protein
MTNQLTASYHGDESKTARFPAGGDFGVTDHFKKGPPGVEIAVFKIPHPRTVGSGHDGLIFFKRV